MCGTTLAAGASRLASRTTASIRRQREKGVHVPGSDNWCDALYFPYGRRKLGGVRCRLEPEHDGDHWCEAEDEMDS